MADDIFDNRTLVVDADVLNPGGSGVWEDLSGSTHGGAGLDTDTFVEGTGSIANRSSASRTGLHWNTETTNDWSNQVLYIWINMTTAAKLQTQANGGITVRLTGTDTSNWFEITVAGADTYFGGFQMFVVDIEEAAANPFATLGTPPATTAIEGIAVAFDTADNVPGSDDNCFVDAIWRLPKASPGIIVRGQNGGNPWTFQDIIDALDNADPTKAAGVISRFNGVIFLNTPIQFGVDDADQDEFADAGEVIFWEAQPVADDFYGFSTAAGSGQMDMTWGTKVGSGASASGVGGMVIGTGGPKWFFTAEDADQDSVGLFGCTFKDSALWSVAQTAVEILSCVFSACDQLTHNNGVTVAKCFFDAAPGPLAQIDLLDDPASTDFFECSFTNMDWWAIEISEAGPVTYNLRGLAFSGNGTDRDILLSHGSGLVTLSIVDSPNGVGGATPGVTNGASITVTTAGASDIRVSAVSLDNVNQTTPVPEVNGNITLAGADPLTAAVTPNDAFSFLFALYVSHVFGAVSWAGGSAFTEEFDDQDILNGLLTSAASKTGVTGAQTASADHSGTAVVSALSVVEVDNQTAAGVTEVDPEFRPVEQSLGSTTHVFSYGVPGETANLAAMVMVHVQDSVFADTDISSVSWGGTNMVLERQDAADDEIEDVDAAIQEDPQNTFSDETADANSAATGDVALLSSPAAINDAFYVGMSHKFDDLEFDISTGATGGWRIFWEYFDGSSWLALTVTDGTSNFTNTSTTNVTFTPPNDWRTTTVNSQGPFFYIRGRVVSQLVSLTIAAVGSGYSTADVLTLTGGTFITAATVNVDTVSTIAAQDETNYDNSPTTEGTFAGGTGYAVSDVNTMSDGSTITVDAVSSGVITQFTVTTNSTTGFVDAATLTQSSTTGAGTGFTMSPDTDNQELETVSVGTEAGSYTVTPGNPVSHSGGTGSGGTFTCTFSSGGNAIGDRIRRIGNAAGSSLRSAIFRLIGSNLRPGTFAIENNVTIEIFGVTEGTRVVIERTDTDVELLNALAFVSDGQGFFKASATFNFSSDTPVRVSAGSSGKVTAAIAEDQSEGTPFTDETLEANDSRSAESMTLVPTIAAPAIGDAYYLGHTEPFKRLFIDISTAGVGAYTLATEYWNGTIWTAVLSENDATNDFKNAGSNEILWATLGDEATRTVTGQPGSSPLYYIRFRVTATGFTTDPVGNTVKLDVTLFERWEDTATIVLTGLSAKATWIAEQVATFAS